MADNHRRQIKRIYTSRVVILATVVVPVDDPPTVMSCVRVDTTLFDVVMPGVSDAEAFNVVQADEDARVLDTQNWYFCWLT